MSSYVVLIYLLTKMAIKYIWYTILKGGVNQASQKALISCLLLNILNNYHIIIQKHCRHRLLDWNASNIGLK
jgi:hypothetical protein